MYAPTLEHATAASTAVAPAPTDPWLSPEQIVAELPPGTATVRQVRGWIQRGVLERSHPATGVWLVRRSALDRWIEGGMRRTRPDAKPRGRRTPMPEPIEPARARTQMSRRTRRSTELRLT